MEVAWSIVKGCALLKASFQILKQSTNFFKKQKVNEFNIMLIELCNGKRKKWKEKGKKKMTSLKKKMAQSQKLWSDKVITMEIYKKAKA